MPTETSRSEFPFEKARNTLCPYGHELVETARSISAEKRMTHVLEPCSRPCSASQCIKPTWPWIYWNFLGWHTVSSTQGCSVQCTHISIQKWHEIWCTSSRHALFEYPEFAHQANLGPGSIPHGWLYIFARRIKSQPWIKSFKPCVSAYNCITVVWISSKHSFKRLAEASETGSWLLLNPYLAV